MPAGAAFSPSTLTLPLPLICAASSISDMLGVMQEYTRLWLARNRSGGLGDSVARFDKARADYGWYPFDSYPC